MRQIVWLFVCVLVAGSASGWNARAAEQTQLRKQEVDAATHEYTTCLMVASTDLDDRTSEPAVVGAKLATACDAAYKAVEQAAVRGADPSDAKKTHEDMLKERVSIATQYVVEVRKRIDAACNSTPNAQLAACGHGDGGVPH